MKTTHENMKYILSYPEQLDISLAKRIPGYLWINGLQNTLAYLDEIEWKAAGRTKSKNKSDVRHSEEARENEKSISKKNMFQFFSQYITNELNMEEESTKGLPLDNLTYMHCHKAVFALSLDLVRMLPYLSKKEEKKESEQNKEQKKNTTVEAKLKMEGGRCDTLILGKNIYNKYYLFNKCYKEKNSGHINSEEEKTAFALYKQSQERISSMFDEKIYEKYEGLFRSREGSRLILGMGEASVKEISFHMNSFYALPEITSTAIKGVFHHYCEEIGLDNDTLAEWFGTEEKEGSIVFLSCIPENYKLERDVMNSHYSEYYETKVPRNQKFPTIKTPIPLKFYAVNVVKVKIVFYYKKGIEKNRKVKIKEVFCQCMEDCNLGAKGAVGYGYFQEERDK